MSSFLALALPSDALVPRAVIGIGHGDSRILVSPRLEHGECGQWLQPPEDEPGRNWLRDFSADGEMSWRVCAGRLMQVRGGLGSPTLVVPE